ncbi:hypothetical protein BH11CYA1_BH11CYA1_44920 [soil metagenome]
MSSSIPATLRASDPIVGTNAGKSSLITSKLTSQTKTTVEMPESVSLSAGYRSLMLNDSLAGRSNSRAFRNEEREDGCSRLRMVNRLRQKERWLIWKEFFKDFDHNIGAFFQKCTPSGWNNH